MATPSKDEDSRRLQIQEAVKLADIPADFAGLKSQIWNSGVFAIAGSQKKKRSEIAIAIDRQGINIYDIRQSRLVTSYATPPQATFTCPPCSVLYRSSTDNPARRVTYCSVNSPRPRILCFTEYTGSALSLENNIVSSAIDLDNDDSPIIHLDINGTINDEDEQSSHTTLIAIHQDGNVSCYASNLAVKEWSARTCAEGSAQVEVAEITSVRRAKKGILSNRTDALAMLGASPEVDDMLVLVLLTRPVDKGIAESTSLHVFGIHSPSETHDLPAAVISGQLRNLLTLKVPEQPLRQGESSRFRLNAASGRLYQHTAITVSVFDLTGIVPVLTHRFDLNQASDSSSLEINPGLLAVATSTTVSIIGLPHCSLQASTPLCDSSAPNPTDHHARLLSYFAPSNAIIALQDRRILTFSLSPLPDRMGARKRKHETELADSVGKGTFSITNAQVRLKTSDRNPRSLGIYLPGVEDAAWIERKSAMDAHHARGEVAALYQVIASQITLKSCSSTLLDQRVVSYALSKIFSVLDRGHLTGVEYGNGKGLIMHDLPRDLFKLLLKNGLLSTTRIELALKQYRVLEKADTLACGALVRAIVQKDDTLTDLLSLLKSHVPMNVGELVEILAIIMQRYHETHNTEDIKLLADSRGANGHLQTTTDDDDDNDDGVVSHSIALPSGFTTAASMHCLLHHILLRLSQNPRLIVTHALRLRFPTLQLVGLVNILRFEIARTGWLSPYEDGLEWAPSSSTDELKNIAHLLNSAIDAIGTAGWALGSGTHKDIAQVADTVSYMRAEISAALEGIEEAVYLGGLLGEILLCGKKSLIVPRPPNGKPDALSRDDAHNVTIQRQAKPLTMSLVEGNSNVLPIGLKMEQVVPLTKVGAGGEVMERSSRSIGHLKSKLVGKYSFERILV